MNLSNKLTLSRIAMTFLLMGLIYRQSLVSCAAALFIFILACATDFLDGWLARRRNETSDFGKIMDPVADKVLVLGVFLSFVQLQLVPAWMVIVIFIREFLITGIRLFAIKRGRILVAETAGKHKTVSQMATIFFLLLFILAKKLVARMPALELETYQGYFGPGIFILMSITLVLTVCSGFSYVWHNRDLIKSI